MSETAAKIGVGADLFDTAGRPMFGSAPLSLFSDAGLAWSVGPVKGGKLPPEAFTDYDALLVGAPGCRTLSSREIAVGCA
jgi:hypothetical protein